MAGFTPNEGETLIANILYKRDLVDRDADLELGLFTNTSGIDESLTEATISEPTGGGYARKTLTDASWTVTGDQATYAQQTFTASGGDYSAAVQGYFIATISAGGTKRLLHVEKDPDGPFSITDGDSYNVDLSNTVA